MTWLNPADIKAPQQSDYPTLADFILAYTAHQDVANPSKFLAVPPEFPYTNPQVYIASMVQNALNIPKFSAAFAPPTWNATLAGVSAALTVIGYLSQIAVNAGDPNSVSVLTAWENGTGKLYGGHTPIPAKTGDGTNAATGQSAVVGPSIL